MNILLSSVCKALDPSQSPENRKTNNYFKESQIYQVMTEKQN